MAMSQRAKHLFEFGPFCLDATERLLLREGKEVSLPPKVFDTLMVLVENSGCILEKDQLMKMLWPESFVEESSLSQNVFLLRKALGEGSYIETIPKRGYRFVAPVKEVWNGNTELVVNRRVETRFAIEEEQETGETRRAEEPELKDAAKSNGVRALAETNDQAIALGEKSPADTSIEAAIRKAAPRPWRLAAFCSLALLALAALSFAIYQPIKRQLVNPSAAPFQNMRLSKLTFTGKAGLPALSSDGKYVAHVVEEAGRQSLWMRQVATTSNVQVVPPAEVEYQGLTFSRDGDFIYYVVYPRPKHIGTLYLVPALGGTPKKLIEDVDSAVTLSPDGARLAFIRLYPSEREAVLIVAQTDGSGERKLAARKLPATLSITGPAWSPDGKIIACVAGAPGPRGISTRVVGVEVADGLETQIAAPDRLRISHVAWLGDGSGLIVTARDQQAATFPDQIWHLSYPQGEARRITNDLQGYSGLSLAADTRALATMQYARVSRFWVAPGGEASRAVQLNAGFMDNCGEKLGLAWMPDGRIVYGSQASGNPDIWVMNPDGHNQQQLTVDPHADLTPAVSADGRYVAFISNRGGAFNVWRMDADGGNPKQLTSGPGEDFPNFSPDGKWVVYSSFGTSHSTIWKVPTDGGAPVPLTDAFSFMPLVSPDGMSVACYYLDPRSLQTKLGLVPFEGGPVARSFDTVAQYPPTLRWTADGQALSYIDTRGGVSNIWSQPVAGGPPQQLTDFKSDQIYRFAWSSDGHNLACERGVSINDVVLINDFK